jgi:hypothetical protein
MEPHNSCAAGATSPTTPLQWGHQQDADPLARSDARGMWRSYGSAVTKGGRNHTMAALLPPHQRGLPRRPGAAPPLHRRHGAALPALVTVFLGGVIAATAAAVAWHVFACVAGAAAHAAALGSGAAAAYMAPPLRLALPAPTATLLPAVQQQLLLARQQRAQTLLPTPHHLASQQPSRQPQLERPLPGAQHRCIALLHKGHGALTARGLHAAALARRQVTEAGGWYGFLYSAHPQDLPSDTNSSSTAAVEASSSNGSGPTPAAARAAPAAGAISQEAMALEMLRAALGEGAPVAAIGRREVAAVLGGALLEDARRVLGEREWAWVTNDHVDVAWQVGARGGGWGVAGGWMGRGLAGLGRAGGGYEWGQQ